MGCDLVVYSVTKFIGGHSDLIADQYCSANLINQIRVTRTIISIPIEYYLANSKIFVYIKTKNG